MHTDFPLKSADSVFLHTKAPRSQTQGRSIVNIVDAVPEDSGLDIEILDQHQVDG
jgi:hypothetical protein